MTDFRKRFAYRLLRIVLIVVAMLVLVVVRRPERFLPPDMTLGEFFQGLLGAIFLALVLAAAGTRAWFDYQRKKRDKE
ncbi:MAG: hypothetical protein RL404_1775 [Pseudomonadota bacterium]|jgi:hypothetical protein